MPTTKRATRKKTIRATVKKLGVLIATACREAEKLFPETKSGDQKKEWVVDLLNKKVDIPLMTEKQEAALLGLLVDVVCDVIFPVPKAYQYEADELIEQLKK